MLILRAMHVLGQFLRVPLHEIGYVGDLCQCEVRRLITDAITLVPGLVRRGTGLVRRSQLAIELRELYSSPAPQKPIPSMLHMGAPIGDEPRIPVK